MRGQQMNLASWNAVHLRAGPSGIGLAVVPCLGSNGIFALLATN